MESNLNYFNNIEELIIIKDKNNNVIFKNTKAETILSSGSKFKILNEAINGNNNFSIIAYETQNYLKQVLTDSNNNTIELYTKYNGDALDLKAINSNNKFYESLLLELGFVHEEDMSFNKISSILTKIREQLNANRVVLLRLDSNYNALEVKEAKIDSINHFKYDKDLANELFKYIEPLRFFNSEMVFVTTVNMPKVLHNLQSTLLKFHIKNVVIMQWKTNSSYYRLSIENMDTNAFTNELLISINQYIYFIIRSLDYTLYLYNVSYYDSLTKVYNRNKYTEYIDKNNKVSKYGIFYLSLDNLKNINDKFGHNLGDETIKLLVNLIKDVFTSSDIYRVGGDEFVVITKEITKDDFNKYDENILTKIKENNVKCSIGSYYIDEIESLINGVKIAENKMYEMKNIHHNPKAESIIKKVKDSIKNNDFTYGFVPTYNENNQVHGTEIMVKAKNDNENLAIVYPIIESYKCTYIFDYYLIDKAYNFIKKINNDSIYTYIAISYNTLLRNDFLDKIHFFENKYGIMANKLVFEVVLPDKDDFDLTINKITELYKIGYIVDIIVKKIDELNVKLLFNGLTKWIKFDLRSHKDIPANSNLADTVRNVTYTCHARNIKIRAKVLQNKNTLMTIKTLGFNQVLITKPDETLNEDEITSLIEVK